MLKKTLLALAFVGPNAIQTVAAQSTDRYIKTPTGYLMVLRHGDDVLVQLEQLTVRERIPSDVVLEAVMARESAQFKDLAIRLNLAN